MPLLYAKDYREPVKSLCGHWQGLAFYRQPMFLSDDLYAEREEIFLSELTWRKLPFQYKTTQEFFEALISWIGDVFYEQLPKQGFEIREEQIFTSYQIAKAFHEKRPIFAEAGLGTGKTFAYMLPAVCYARFTGKPVILSSASAVLQHQVAGRNGDADTLSDILGLRIDARMAKYPTNYLCQQKANSWILSEARRPKGLTRLLEWANITAEGERTEVPDISDRAWDCVAWDESLNCDICGRRGICCVVRARNHYRQAADFVVCDHSFFFNDLWTRDERIASGLVPYLPFYSGVVFDEGHKVELPAAMAAGRKVSHETVRIIAQDLVDQPDVRRSLLVALKEVFQGSRDFEQQIRDQAVHDEKAARLHIHRSGDLTDKARKLLFAVERLQDEIVTEESMHEETDFGLRAAAYQKRLDDYAEGLSMFRKPESEIVAWVDKSDKSLWVVPRKLSGLLSAQLFGKKVPVVFSSGTLRSGGSSEYLRRTLGVSSPIEASAGVPFNLKEQMLIYLPHDLPEGDSWTAAACARVLQLLRISRGRALVLLDSPADQRLLREFLDGHQLDFPALWEGDGDRTGLVARFKEEIGSVLFGTSFWEGVDIPGESLSLCLIFRLPFPAGDPLIVSRRADAAAQGLDPKTAVDVPEMIIKLRQGCGRLIRTASDRGVLAILEPFSSERWAAEVSSSLPAEAPVTSDIGDVVKFFLI